MATTSRERDRSRIFCNEITGELQIYIYIYILYGHKLRWAGNPRRESNNPAQLATQWGNAIAHDYERSFPFPPPFDVFRLGGGKMLIGVEMYNRGWNVNRQRIKSVGYRFPGTRLLERCFGKNERFPREEVESRDKEGGEKKKKERSEPVENRWNNFRMWSTTTRREWRDEDPSTKRSIRSVWNGTPSSLPRRPPPRTKACSRSPEWRRRRRRWPLPPPPLYFSLLHTRSPVSTKGGGRSLSVPSSSDHLLCPVLLFLQRCSHSPFEIARAIFTTIRDIKWESIERFGFYENIYEKSTENESYFFERLFDWKSARIRSKSSISPRPIMSHPELLIP